MTNEKSKKILLLTSVVSIVLCIALLISLIAVVAAGKEPPSVTPTDPVVETGNGRVVGDADLELLKYNGSDYVDYATDETPTLGPDVVWDAGKTEVVFLQIKNNEERDLNVNLLMNVFNGSSDPLEYGLLYAVIPEMSYQDYVDAELSSWNAMTKRATAGLGELYAGTSTISSDVAVAAGGSTYVTVVIHMDDTIQRTYQNITMNVNISAKEQETGIREAVLYVAPNGHDGNPGTEAQPLKTFRRAAELAKPGTTVVFEDGTYYESGITVIRNSGTKEAPIVFMARNDGFARIVYPETLSETDKMQIFKKEYITIRGFDITQAKPATEESKAPKLDVIVRCSGSNNISFINNRIYGACEEPLKVNNANGILIEGNFLGYSQNEGLDFVNVSDSIVRNNEIFEVGRCGFMAKGGSRSILFYNNFVHNKTYKAEKAFEFGGATDNVSTWDHTTTGYEGFNMFFFNNAIVAEEAGAFSYGIGFMGARDCAAFNNVVIGCDYAVQFQTPDDASMQWEWSPINENPVVKNNVFMNSGKGAFHVKDEPKNLVSDYNLYFGNAGTDPVEEHSVYDKDPMLKAPMRNWELKKDSPAIGAGTLITEVTGYSGQTFFVGFDRNYLLRGETCDIGVYDMDATGEAYEPGGITFQDQDFLNVIDHSIYDAPVIGQMPPLGTELINENFSVTADLKKWIQCARSAGKWTIKDGVVTLGEDTLTGHALLGYSAGLDWSDYEFSAKVQAPSTKSGRSSGILFRADAALENMYGFRFYPDAAADYVEFCMWNNDKFSSIQTFAFNWEPDKVYEMKVIAVGDKFAFYIDGALIATFKDGSHSMGTAGLYIYNENRAFDDLLCKSASGYEIVMVDNSDPEPEYTGKILYEEKFTDSSALDNWKTITGKWKVDGGILTGETGIFGENTIIYKGGYNWVNYELTADIRQPEKGGMWAGLIFRSNSDWSEYYGFRFVNDNFQLVRKYGGGSWQQIGIKAMSNLPKGEVAELKVICEGENFRLYLNGKKVWEFTDKFVTHGTIGMFQQNMTEIIFDNIVVKEIKSDGTVVPGGSTGGDDNTGGSSKPQGELVLDEKFDAIGDWVVKNPTNGKYNVVDGKLVYEQIHDINGGTLLYNKGNWVDFKASMRIRFSDTNKGGNWVRIMLRTTDGSDGLCAYLRNLAQDDVKLLAGKTEVKKASGIGVTSIFDGEYHNVEVEVVDKTLKLSVDGKELLSYTGDEVAETAGSIGFITFGYPYEFDDVKVYCTEVGPEAPVDPEQPDGGNDNTGGDSTGGDSTGGDSTGGTTGGEEGNVVLNEDFSNAANMENWKPSVGNLGDFSYADGKLLYTQTNTDSKAVGSTILYKGGNWEDFTLTAKVLLPSQSGTWIRFLLRTTDGTDGYYVNILNANTDMITINTVNGGTKLRENYGSRITALFDDQIHDLKITVVGNSIKVYIDDMETPIVQTTDNESRVELLSGTIGIMATRYAFTVDDLKVVCTKTGDRVGGVETPDPGADVNTGELVLDTQDSSITQTWEAKAGEGKYIFKDGKLQYVEEPAVIYLKEGAWKDYTIAFKTRFPVTASAESWMKVLLRTTDGTDGSYILFKNAGQDSVSVMVNGKSAALGEKKEGLNFFDGKEHKVKIDVVKDTITVYVDKVEILTVTSDQIPYDRGTIGFSSVGFGYTFEQLKVYRYDPHVVEKTVEVKFDDANNQDGKRPESVTVSVLADGVANGVTAVLNAENNWTYNFTELLKFNGEQEIVYSFAAEVDAYEDTFAEGVLTLKHEPEMISVNVNQVVWNDEEDNSGRPQLVVVTLKIGDQLTEQSATLSGEKWTHSFENLPKYSAGQLIEYSVVTTCTSNFYIFDYNVETETVTGTMVPLVFDLNVTVDWNDGTDDSGRPAEGFEVKLFANGVDTGKTITLTADGNWTGKFEQINRYANAGDSQPIDYTLEYSIDGYAADVTKDLTMSNYTIVTSKLGGKTVSVTWDDATIGNAVRPESVVVTLKNGTAIVGTVTLNADGNWTGDGQVPLYNADNEEIVYTAEFPEVTSYILTAGDMTASYMHKDIIVLQEDFTEETALGNWVNTLTKGTSYGYFEVSSEGTMKYVERGTIGGTAVYKNGVWKDYELTFKVKTPANIGGNWFQILLGSNSNTTGFSVRFRDLNSNEGTIRFNNAEVAGCSSANENAVFDGNWHTIRITKIGNTIDVYDGENKIMTYTDASVGAAVPGTIGFACDTFAYEFDEITVKCFDMVAVSEDFSNASNKANWNAENGSSGTWDYTDGKFVYTNLSGNAGGKALYRDGAWKNLTVSAKVTLPSRGWFRINLRNPATGTGTSVYFSTFKANNNYIVLQQGSTELGGSATSSAKSYFNGKEHTVGITLIETTIIITIDGETVFTMTNDGIGLDAGTVAFQTYVADSTVDDIRVISYDSATP